MDHSTFGRYSKQTLRLRDLNLMTIYQVLDRQMPLTLFARLNDQGVRVR